MLQNEVKLYGYQKGRSLSLGSPVPLKRVVVMAGDEGEPNGGMVVAEPKCRKEGTVLMDEGEHYGGRRVAIMVG